MWTDVDGIMTADPHEVAQANNIPALSYDEMAELAYFGARIIHTRMIAPLRQHDIPLHVKNIFKPRDTGTVISGHTVEARDSLKAVTAIQGISLRADYNGTLTEISSYMDTALYEATGSHIEVMFSSQSALRSFVCFIIPTILGPEAVRTTQNNLQKLLNTHNLDTLWELLTVSVITVIGADLENQTIAKVINTLDHIPILAIAQGPSGCSLSIVIYFDDTEEALEQLHSILLNND